MTPELKLNDFRTEGRGKMYPWNFDDRRITAEP